MNLIDIAACYRLTQLVIDDKITEPLRERVWKQHPPTHGLGFLLACPFCASIWTGGFIVAARRLAPRWWQPVAELLALSALAGEALAHIDH